jgi:hypothetical protein
MSQSRASKPAKKLARTCCQLGTTRASRRRLPEQITNLRDTERHHSRSPPIQIGAPLTQETADALRQDMATESVA